MFHYTQSMVELFMKANTCCYWTSYSCLQAWTAVCIGIRSKVRYLPAISNPFGEDKNRRSAWSKEKKRKTQKTNPPTALKSKWSHMSNLLHAFNVGGPRHKRCAVRLRQTWGIRMHIYCITQPATGSELYRISRMRLSINTRFFLQFLPSTYHLLLSPITSLRDVGSTVA